MNITNINIDNIPTLKVSYSKELLKHQKIKIQSSIEAFEVLKWKRDLDTIELYEEMKVLFLDRKLALLWYRTLWVWSSTWTVINIKLLLSIALSCNAEWFILWHNHPSWATKPSEQDISLTKKIKQWAEYMDLRLIDHLIVTKDAYYSFADESNI